MQTTEQWLEDQLIFYKDDPRETLEDMLVNTTDIIKRFSKDPTRKMNQDLLETCLKHNELFLKEIGITV
jgi:hypothetical protein